MPDSPPDQFASVDLTVLSYQQLTDYRQELIQAILNPGIEYDEASSPGRPADFASNQEKQYRDRLAEVDKYLHDNFGEDVGGNLP
jgi:hypothetical protein